MNDKLIERLRKILALAGNNTSQEEAQAAMAKAQAIALEHGIDLSLLGGQKEDDNQICQETLEFGGRLPTVNNYVSAIVVNHFHVRIIRSGGRNSGRTLIFVGKTDDIQVAKYIYMWLSETMVRCWHHYYKTNFGVQLAAKQSYLNGFYVGLNNRLESNRKKVESDKLITDGDRNKYALAVVTQERRIQTFIDEEIGKLRKSPKKTIRYYSNSFEQGVVDGNNCQMVKGGVGNATRGWIG